MNCTVKNVLISSLFIFLPLTVVAQDNDIVMARDAIHHDGEYVQVCGIIAETNYVRGSKGKPTYLNFTNPYPKHTFTVIIWKKDRKNFDYKPESLEGYQACAYGLVTVRKSRPEMVIGIQDQISARKIESAPPEPTQEETPQEESPGE